MSCASWPDLAARSRNVLDGGVDDAWTTSTLRRCRRCWTRRSTWTSRARGLARRARRRRAALAPNAAQAAGASARRRRPPTSSTGRRRSRCRPRTARPRRASRPATLSAPTACCARSATAAWARCGWPSAPTAALKRKVALKLPHVTWAPGLAERFAREREILASLEHPNIARLYDAGVDRTAGRTWRSNTSRACRIDEFCRERALPVEGRLRLLLQVADAVAFAHSRLVHPPRPEARQHPGDRRRPGAPARLRHRQADGGRRRRRRPR